MVRNTEFAASQELLHRDDINNALLGIGGLGYTVCYVLMTHQSIRDRTYAMPLFSLAFNFAWEIVFALYVSKEISEKVMYTIWGVIDLGLVYSVVRYGANEWRHAPIVAQHLGKIFAVMLGWCIITLYTFCAWWLNAPQHSKSQADPQYVLGKVDVNIVELGFWTALLAQVVLSVMSLAQITIRGTSGGSSYSVWLARFIGSVCGLNLNYLYGWKIWPDLHGYVMNPVAVVMMVTWVLADLAYFVVLRRVKRAEVVLASGRKTRGLTEQAQKHR